MHIAYLIKEEQDNLSKVVKKVEHLVVKGRIKGTLVFEFDPLYGPKHTYKFIITAKDIKYQNSSSECVFLPPGGQNSVIAALSKNWGK